MSFTKNSALELIVQTKKSGTDAVEKHQNSYKWSSIKIGDPVWNIINSMISIAIQNYSAGLTKT